MFPVRDFHSNSVVVLGKKNPSWLPGSQAGDMREEVSVCLLAQIPASSHFAFGLSSGRSKGAELGRVKRSSDCFQPAANSGRCHGD